MKDWEVLEKRYSFLKYTRKLRFKEHWTHVKFYNTEQACIDAIRDFKKNSKEDYPGSELESTYPHIKPVIIIRRYKYKRTI